MYPRYFIMDSLMEIAGVMFQYDSDLDIIFVTDEMEIL
ncbi:hypothetical protein GAP52_066 [Cronobacter phage vB_CsaP_GAP52]|uniref:Uncharacterized protein n=1 Tax=Cronobacter phage vB_CsaP_GAP52 TaxID=1141137 RepID=K4F9T3_9CAUD|nr:hypothetical protein D858_gp048 [Cronobacter phage vB_CsaP_GAP52]AFC22060.1 hypothetical protein GAP52_066 [Cronobacter phage vB_CsaP_GAP52]